MPRKRKAKKPVKEKIVITYGLNLSLSEVPHVVGAQFPGKSYGCPLSLKCPLSGTRYSNGKRISIKSI
jgi:hypothetical protein